jgi:hypothetical protein
MAGKKAGKRSTPDANKRAAGKKNTGRALMASTSELPAGYRELLEDLKTRVRAAQLKAAVAVHRELIQLYWNIGRLATPQSDLAQQTLKDPYVFDFLTPVGGGFAASAPGRQARHRLAALQDF